MIENCVHQVSQFGLGAWSKQKRAQQQPPSHPKECALPTSDESGCQIAFVNFAGVRRLIRQLMPDVVVRQFSENSRGSDFPVDRHAELFASLHRFRARWVLLQRPYLLLAVVLPIPKPEHPNSGTGLSLLSEETAFLIPSAHATS